MENKIINIGEYTYTINEDIGGLDVTYIGKSEHVTESPLGEINGIKVCNFSHLFHGNNYIKTVDMSSWDLSNINSIDYMFAFCDNLRSVNFGEGFDILSSAVGAFYSTTNLTTVTGLSSKYSIVNCSDLFSDCEKLEAIDLSNFEIRGTANKMFDYCCNLKEVKFSQEGILYKLNPLFYRCTNLKEINLNNIIINMDKGNNIIDDCPNIEKIYVKYDLPDVIQNIIETNKNASVILNKVYKTSKI